MNHTRPSSNQVSSDEYPQNAEPAVHGANIGSNNESNQSESENAPAVSGKGNTESTFTTVRNKSHHKTSVSNENMNFSAAARKPPCGVHKL